MLKRPRGNVSACRNFLLVPSVTKVPFGTNSKQNMGDEIDVKYKEANKLLLRLRREITEKLEPLDGNQYRSDSLHFRSTNSQSSTSTTVDRETALNNLMVDVNTLSRLIAELDPLISQLYAAKKQFWTAKTRQMVEECKSLRENLDRYLRTKNASAVAEDQRTRLFEGKTKSSNSGLQNLLGESVSLTNSNRMLSELEEIGSNIVASLITQNNMIKRAHQRVLDMGHSLGVSRTVMRSIERRQFFDKLVVYTGILLACLIIGAMYWYFRK